MRHADHGSGTLVQFALGTGMLMGEILSLSSRTVDLTRRTAMVFQSKYGEHRTIPLNQTVLNVITGRGTIRSLSTDLVFPSKTHASLKNTFMMSCRSICCFHWSCNPKPKASLGFKVDFPLFIGGRPNHSGVATIEIVDVTSDI